MANYLTKVVAGGKKDSNLRFLLMRQTVAVDIL